MTKVTSMKGKSLDLGQIMAQNETALAIGNAKMNARGDIVGPGGQIVKRHEQIAQDYHRTNPKAVQKISLKEVEPDVFLSPAEAVAKVKAEIAEQKKAIEAAAAVPATKKISDSEE